MHIYKAVCFESLLTVYLSGLHDYFTVHILSQDMDELSLKKGRLTVVTLNNYK